MTKVTIVRQKDKGLKISIDRDSNDMPFDVVDELEEHNFEHHVSSMDGWEFIYDDVNDLVYWATDYGFSMWRELRAKGVVVLRPHKNSRDHYEGYEWNKGRKWRKVVVKNKTTSKSKSKKKVK
jgi:hypothetical protein